MPEPRWYYVYILASYTGTLYVGVTRSLLRRMFEHKNHTRPGFTSQYGVVRLLYYERFGDVRDAIAREKQLKGWRREKKIALVKQTNPGWVDLSRDWFSSSRSSGLDSRDASTRAYHPTTRKPGARRGPRGARSA